MTTTGSDAVSPHENASRFRGDPAFLRTERLVLRRFTEADAGHLIELDADPEVMRFINGGRPTPPEVVRDEVLPAILAGYRRHPGFGTWAAVERSGGAFVGWFGFHPVDGRPPDEVELGYRLRRQFWGRGYATEGSHALIRLGFTELGVRRVFATTMTVNAASRRVMEKLGLRFVRTFFEEWPEYIDGAEHGDVEYELLCSSWLIDQR